MQLLSESQSSDRERFYKIKEEILLYNNMHSLGYTCYSCNNKGHVAKFCKEIHLTNQIIKTHCVHNSIEINMRKGYNLYNRRIRKKCYAI